MKLQPERQTYFYRSNNNNNGDDDNDNDNDNTNSSSIMMDRRSALRAKERTDTESWKVTRIDMNFSILHFFDEANQVRRDPRIKELFDISVVLTKHCMFVCLFV
mmetsp:Transcript_26884/g.41210  ORF Transcript_26884/g.41210 Transcript_26884/m.41210 type:complete len:104 (+) Transcript_26884:69-380(+)